MSFATELLKLLEASDSIGKWLSAALDDPGVCEEMKEDIRGWFEAVHATEQALGKAQG